MDEIFQMLLDWSLPATGILLFLAAFVQSASGRSGGFVRIVGWAAAILTIVSSISVGYLAMNGGNGWGIAIYIPVIAAFVLMAYCWESAGVHRVMAGVIVFLTALPAIGAFVMAQSGNGTLNLHPAWLAIPVLAHLVAGIIILLDKSWDLKDEEEKEAGPESDEPPPPEEETPAISAEDETAAPVSAEEEVAAHG